MGHSGQFGVRRHLIRTDLPVVTVAPARALSIPASRPIRVGARARVELANGDVWIGVVTYVSGEVVGLRSAAVTRLRVAPGDSATLVVGEGDSMVAAQARVLAEDAVMLADGGGKASAIARPLHGGARIAKVLVGFARLPTSRWRLQPARVNGLPGCVVVDDATGRVVQTIARAFVVQPDILLADEAFGHLDEVTAAELRETFLALARECGSTAILITHQLEEAISVGDRVVVFGKSANVLADIHVAQWPKEKYALLREAIQFTLQNNRPDPRLAL